MAISFEPRIQKNRTLSFCLPIIAIVMTFLLSMILFYVLGKEPWATAKAIFIAPFFDGYSRPEIFVKAAPLLIIAIGLSIGFRANIWNIGAEGQFIMGGIGATFVAMAFYPDGGPFLLPFMALGGMFFGLLWALIPAILKVQFQTSEILVSLMLVYVADLILFILVSGYLQDPQGMGFPKSRSFQPDALLPIIWSGTRVHLGVIIALFVAIGAAVFMKYHRLGFDVVVSGLAPRAAKYSGANSKAVVIFSLCLGGALAGLAGMLEVSGPVGQLSESFGTGLGFTAIIVAFLGRLNPWAIIPAAIMIAVTYIGGETASTFMRLPAPAVLVIQGMMLFLLLGVEVFGNYKLKWERA